jgi:hypothetical protein
LVGDGYNLKKIPLFLNFEMKQILSNQEQSTSRTADGGRLLDAAQLDTLSELIRLQKLRAKLATAGLKRLRTALSRKPRRNLRLETKQPLTRRRKAKRRRSPSVSSPKRGPANKRKRKPSLGN